MKAKAPLWLLAIVSVLTACQQEYGIPACARTADMPPALKMEHYRSPTPACVPNAETLDTTGLQKLIAAEKPVLVDVYALQRSAVNEGFGSVWLPNKAHESLPAAIWLPNVGYGTIEADIEAYFQRELQRLTADDKTIRWYFIALRIAGCHGMPYNAPMIMVISACTGIEPAWMAGRKPVCQSSPLNHNRWLVISLNQHSTTASTTTASTAAAASTAASSTATATRSRAKSRGVGISIAVGSPIIRLGAGWAATQLKIAAPNNSQPSKENCP